MRQVTQRLAAVGATPLIPLTRYTWKASTALRVTLLPATTATYSVEHTFDDPWLLRSLAFTRVTTTATFTLPAHQLANNDSVCLFPVAPLNAFVGDVGLTQTSNLLTVAGADTFTVPVVDAGPVEGTWGAVVCRMALHDVLFNQTASAQSNYEYPPGACRIRATAMTGAGLDFSVIQQGV